MSLLRDALRFGYGSTNVWLYVVRRLLLLVPQVLAVTTIVFFLNRLLPGDPAYMIAGSLATKDVVASVREANGTSISQSGISISLILVASRTEIWESRG